MANATTLPISADFVFRHTSDAIVLLDGAGRVTYANGRAETLLQLDISRVVGQPIRSWLPDFEGSRAEAQLWDVKQTALERRVEHFSPSRYTWYELRAVRQGDHLVLFLRDVSDRARLARTDAVREALRQVIMDAPVAISITRGPDHRYEIVNNMARRLIGNREVEGRTARAAFPEIDQSMFAILDDVYRTGKPVSITDLEVSFDRDESGKLVKGLFDVTYQPMLEADGSVSGILSTSVETTNYAAERRRIAHHDA